MKRTFQFLLFSLFLTISITYQACTPKVAEQAAKTETPEITKAEILAEDESIKLETEVEDVPVPVIKDIIPVDPEVRMGTLDNGLKYYIRKNEKPENRAELRLALNAGAINEDDDQQGLAHFVEHMAFNGSTNFKKSELVDYLETVGTRFGPDLNAYTSFDETVYMLQTRTDSMELLYTGLLVLEDWAGGIAFEDEEIDKERGVVESEWRSGLSANQRMLNEWLPVMYKDSRYAKRLPIGKMEVIRNAPYETVRRFYRDWYRPNLMAVILVGDFDVDEMEKEVKERFSKLQNPKPLRPRESYDVPAHKETLVSINSDKEATNTTVQLVYKHPHLKTETLADYRRNIIHRLYNGMLSARLSELAQSANPPYTFAYSGYNSSFGDIDQYTSYASVPEGGAIRGLEAVVTENERVLRHGFSQSELERQKMELLTRMESAQKEKDKTDSRRFASKYVYVFLDDNPMPSIDDELKFYKEMLPTIKLAEVNKLAKKWITDENRVVVINGPEKQTAPMPTETEVRNVLDRIKQMDIPAYEDNVSEEPLLANIPAPVEITEEHTIKKVGVTELTLANGVKVVLKPTDFKNDEILISAYSEGGTSLYPDEDYQSASNAARIITESGVGNFDKTQLEKKLTGKDLQVSPYIYEYYEGIRGNSSQDDLETAMQLIYLYFTAPRKDEVALKSFKTKQAAYLQNILSNPDYWFMDKVTRIQYNNHPRRGWPTAGDLEKIDLDRLYQIYQERFADASDFTFFFTGSFEMDNIKPLLSTYLGNLPAKNQEEKMKDVGADYLNGRIEKSFKRGKAPKAQISMKYHGKFEWNAQNRYDFDSMIELLRIKMRESMREDKGGVYGVRISGNTSKFPEPEYSISISFNADPPMVDELIKTAMQDISNAKKMGAEDKDLAKVKELQRQGRIKALIENRYWDRTLQNSYKYGNDPAEITLEAYEKFIIGLDSKDIQKAAQKYFDQNNFFKIVMLPEDTQEN